MPGLRDLLPPSPPACLAAGLLLALIATSLAAPAGAAGWTPIGAAEPDVVSLAVVPGEPPILLAAWDGALWKLTGEGGSWQEVPVPGPTAFTDDQGFDRVPFDVRLVAVRIAPRDPDLWLVSFHYREQIEFDGNPITFFERAAVRRTLDGGETWNPYLGGQVVSLGFAPSRPGLLYAALVDPQRGGRFFTLRVEPDGTWVTIVPATGSGLMRSLTVDAADPLHVYAHSEEGTLFVTTDGGETWTAPAVPEPVGQIAAHPSIPGTAVALGRDGSVWRTLDGGVTWDERGPLPSGDPIYGRLALDPIDAGRLYAVVEGTAYTSDDDGATWQALTEGLPAGAEIRELVVDPADPSRLFASVEEHGIWRLDRLFPSVPCLPDAWTLCLGDDGRFAARVVWQDFAFDAGHGRAVELPANDTGAFWFFAPHNLELIVKALDGRPVDGHHWVFYGSLTNVPFTLVVTDTATGETVGYYNPSRRFASRGDTAAFPEGGPDVAPPPGEVTAPIASVTAPAPCAPGPAALCLAGGRFRVEVDWEDFHGATGAGTAVPATDGSGFFWFFRDGNLELGVKVLDGGPINGRWWVFYGALTNVEFSLRVTDTENGEVRTYRNPSGNFASRGDTSAFAD